MCLCSPQLPKNRPQLFRRIEREGVIARNADPVPSKTLRGTLNLDGTTVSRDWPTSLVSPTNLLGLEHQPEVIFEDIFQEDDEDTSSGGGSCSPDGAAPAPAHDTPSFGGPSSKDRSSQGLPVPQQETRNYPAKQGVQLSRGGATKILGCSGEGGGALLGAGTNPRPLPKALARTSPASETVPGSSTQHYWIGDEKTASMNRQDDPRPPRQNNTNTNSDSVAKEISLPQNMESIRQRAQWILRQRARSDDTADTAFSFGSGEHAEEEPPRSAALRVLGAGEKNPSAGGEQVKKTRGDPTSKDHPHRATTTKETPSSGPLLIASNNKSFVGGARLGGASARVVVPPIKKIQLPAFATTLLAPPSSMSLAAAEPLLNSANVMFRTSLKIPVFSFGAPGFGLKSPRVVLGGELAGGPPGGPPESQEDHDPVDHPGGPSRAGRGRDETTQVPAAKRSENAQKTAEVGSNGVVVSSSWAVPGGETTTISGMENMERARSSPRENLLVLGESESVITEEEARYLRDLAAETQTVIRQISAREASISPRYPK